MKESVRKTRKHAFVVRSSDLQKLWTFLEDRIGTVTISAKCSDDVEREFDDQKELVSYDNPPAKRVVELSIKSRFNYGEKYANISFSSGRPFDHTSISIAIEAQERVDSEVKDKIFDILEGIRPWYSFLAQTTSPFVLLSGICVYFVLVLVLGELWLKFTSLEGASEFARFSFFASLFSVAAFSMMGLNRLRMWVFPLSYFALGQGKHRYEIGEKVRWGIVIAFVVSLAASIVSLIW